ncbi:hypothetical protein [Phenylobacterium sp.]|uniref:hypothetical protein n=1 Tax=Phenylobacterium sp. TaxID=1871053 RepID=UPI0025FF5F03|nr:hypothetical protein [Phenylobacterium sp.]
MTPRFAIRRDDKGWSVFDIWTGLVAQLEDGQAAMGLRVREADELADVLSRAARLGLIETTIEDLRDDPD